MSSTKEFPPLFPKVDYIISPKDMSKEDFVSGRPEGITLHYLADRSVNRAHRTLVDGGLGYHIVIDRMGSVYQLAFLNRRVNHAGKAVWLGKSPNRQHIAIALASWGILTIKKGAFYSWAGIKIPPSEAVARPSNVDGKTYVWDAATEKQEAKLLEILRWFVVLGINPEDICDHSECAVPVGRKLDIGGVLSVTTHEIRENLKLKHSISS
jgi:N-acetyl-anhydromuramyl-L-alanine amidase AmpD